MMPDSARFEWPLQGPALALWDALALDSGVQVAILDAGGAVLQANRPFARAHGKASPAAVAGRSLADLMPEEMALERQDLIREVLESGRPVRLRTVWRGVHQDVFLRPLPTAGGRAAVLCTVSCEPGGGAAGAGEARLVRARHIDEGPLAVLSPRERTVLGLIGAGLPTAQIAEVLGRSTKTIENQRLSMGRKLNVRNRVELARIAIRSGLVTKVPENGRARKGRRG